MLGGDRERGHFHSTFLDRGLYKDMSIVGVHLKCDGGQAAIFLVQAHLIKIHQAMVS
jgi:hypothetical protein